MNFLQLFFHVLANLQANPSNKEKTKSDLFSSQVREKIVLDETGLWCTKGSEPQF